MYHVIFHLPFFHLQRRHRVPLLGSAHGWTFFPFFFPTLRALAFQFCSFFWLPLPIDTAQKFAF
jgi:hypothetical protein